MSLITCNLSPWTKRDYLTHLLQINKFPQGKNDIHPWGGEGGRFVLAAPKTKNHRNFTGNLGTDARLGEKLRSHRL
ncbi:MAG: hypothetical protein AB9833_02585 [Bacteroidales bacterium]